MSERKFNLKFKKVNTAIFQCINLTRLSEAHFYLLQYINIQATYIYLMCVCVYKYIGLYIY